MNNSKSFRRLKKMDKKQFTELFLAACRQNKRSLIEKMLFSCEDKNRDYLKEKGFIIACNTNNITMMKYFMNAPRELKFTKLFPYQLFFYVGRMAHPEAVDFILEHAILEKEHDYRFAMHAILETGAVDFFHKFCQKIGDISPYINYQSYEYAIKASNPELALFLFKHYPVKNEIQINSLFHYATEVGNIKLVQYLLTSNEIPQKANIHSNDDEALFRATFYNHVELVKYLLTSLELNTHCNVNARYGNMLNVAKEKKHYELIKYFLSFKEITSAPHMHYTYTSLLSLACKNNNLEMVKYLLNHPEIKDKNKLIHHDNDQLFKMAYEHAFKQTKDASLLEYLIVGYGIKKTPTIRQCIQNHPDSVYFENLFTIKKQYDNLSKLPKKETIKRPKI